MLLDLNTELKKLKPIKLLEEEEMHDSSIVDIFKLKIKQLQNQNKQQFKIVQELEFQNSNIINQIANTKNVIDEIIRAKKELERQVNSILFALIEVYDLLTNFYQIAKKLNDLNIESALEKLLVETKSKLLNVGCLFIETTNVPFDVEKHYTIGYAHNQEIPNGYIVEIFNLGIIFEGKIIRKAEVIVNKI